MYCLCGCQDVSKGKDLLFISKEFSETGIDFQNNLPEEIDFAFNCYNYYNYYNGAGVAVGDINNDGLQDVYFTSNLEDNKLYLNKGNLQFEDITAKAGVAGQSEWSTGVTMADIDGDGWLDIYTCCLGGFDGKKGRNELFINNRDLTFTESAAEYGIDISAFSTQASFFDYDNDGDLDMYLLNHSMNTVNTFAPRGVMLNRTHDKIGDRLFRNEQEQYRKEFVDVTASSGILSTPVGFGLGIGCSDFNQDGWIDIYITNDFHENDYLYINQGDGTFIESLDKWIGHTSTSSMGNDIADFNNDGLTDIITLDMLPHQQEVLQKSMEEAPYELREIVLKNGYHPSLSRNNLQLNRGERFSEIAPLAGVHTTDWSWAPLFVDLDNDGMKDLYISNGILRRANDLDYLDYVSQSAIQSVIDSDVKGIKDRLIKAMPQNPISNVAYHNVEALKFSNETKAWGLSKSSYSNGAAYADLDNDGDMELIVNNINEKALLFENRTNEQLVAHRYLTISLKGEKFNTTGIGAKVIIKHKGIIYYQEQVPVRGFMSSVGHTLTFGLGTLSEVDSLWVVWPGGAYQFFNNVRTGHTLEVKEKDAFGEYYSEFIQPAQGEQFFRNADDVSIDYLHEENEYHDIYREYLIPRLLSAEGPGMTIGDINNDGLDDLFLTNAQYRPDRMFIQKKSGEFLEVNSTVFGEDSLYEGIDAVFFDADMDSDLDLYVASAGNEHKIGAQPLMDRLYLNDGKGNFKKEPGALPGMYGNTACVKPADYDKDGDMDLFIGARDIAGSYGLSPRSYFLQNDGHGNFTEDSVPRELANIGMVTDAVWADFDGDSWVDLAIVGEWMPVTFFQNQKGTFTHSSIHPLTNTNGWWNCVIIDDFDNDGDTDLVAGNVGLNTRLKVVPQQPIRLYLKDFDNNGSLDQIMTCYREGMEYPFATKDQLSKQLSFLENKFTTYNAFSGVTMEKLFSTDQMKSTIIKEAIELQSIYIENLENNEYEIHPLPIEANFSPIMSIVSRDINMDGLKDIIVAGNFYGFTPGMGRQDASLGLLLINKGGNYFETVDPSRSGIIIDGQVRDMSWIELENGKTALVIAKNNEALEIIELGN